MYKDADERAKTLKGTAVMRNPSGVTAEQLIKSGLFKDELAQQKELYPIRNDDFCLLSSCKYTKKMMLAELKDVNQKSQLHLICIFYT